MRILFFSPYGGRNGGADVTLWNTFEHLDRSKYQPFLFCNHAPSLMEERKVDIPYYVSENTGSVISHIKDRLNHKLFDSSSYERQVLKLHKKLKPDVWYINSASIMHEVAAIASKHRIPYIAHFHELLSNFVYLKASQLKTTVENAAMLIGCSQIACKNLEVLNGKNIKLFYEAVKVSEIRTDAKRVQELRKKLNISPDAFVWGMAGFTQYRKGVDLLPTLSENLRDTNMHILWIGKVNDSGYDYFMQEEFRKKNITNVHFVGEQSVDFYNYLDGSNGFLLTSREDAFPLVMIEAAALGKPIVSFNSGGVKEFVKPGMGIVIDSWNATDMAEAMRKVMKGELALDAAISKTRASEFDIKNMIATWEHIVDSINLKA